MMNYNDVERKKRKREGKFKKNGENLGKLGKTKPKFVRSAPVVDLFVGEGFAI